MVSLTLWAASEQGQLANGNCIATIETQEEDNSLHLVMGKFLSTFGAQKQIVTAVSLRAYTYQVTNLKSRVESNEVGGENSTPLKTKVGGK